MLEKQLELQGKKIIVVDEFFSAQDLRKLNLICDATKVTRIGYSRPDAMDSAHYSTLESVEDVRQSKIFHMVSEKVSQYFPSCTECTRITYREIIYGDYLVYHTDGPKTNATAMIYVNEEWKDDYRGETMFVGTDGLGLTVMPKPGRLVLFDASIMHSSSTPSRVFFGARKILVFNLVTPAAG